MRDNEDEKTVAAMDLLVPGIGELIGGGLGRRARQPPRSKTTTLKDQAEEEAAQPHTRPPDSNTHTTRPQLAGGSQREERLPNLLAKMESVGLDPADYWRAITI